MPVPTVNDQNFYGQITANATAQAMGKMGCAFFNAGTAFTTAAALHPKAVAIQVINDTVFTTMTGDTDGFLESGTTSRAYGYNYTNVALNTITFPAGTYITGKFTNIVVASGVILVYFG